MQKANARCPITISSSATARWPPRPIRRLRCRHQGRRGGDARQRVSAGGARHRRQPAGWCCPAASTAIAISSSAPRLGSSAPTISTAPPCRRRSAAPPRSSRSPRSTAANRCARSSRNTTRRARPKAVIDYAFHLIISDPTEQVLGQELPALIRDGYTSFKVYMTYDLLQLDDGQMLDILAVARARGRARHGPRREPRHDQMADRAAARAAASARRAITPSATRARRGRGDQPRRRAVAELLDVPILIVHVSAGEAIEVIRNAQTGPQDLCRDLPAISVPDRRRHRQARDGGRQVLLQPAAARPRGAGGGVDAACATARSRCFPPTTRPTASTRSGKLPKGDKTDLQGDRQRRARASSCACRCCFPKGSGKGRLDLKLCRTDRDQPRQALRPLPEQGHDRGRQRRRHRDLGPATRDHGHRRRCCTTSRLHAL